MVKTTKYHFIFLIIFKMVLGLLIFKPIYHYVSHFNDNEDIELCEDLSESPLEEEDCCDTENLYDFTVFDVTIKDITSVIKLSKKKYMHQIIEIYKDVLIPPPKFI